MLAPSTKHPDYNQRTADKSCSPHASCWHPAPNTQTTTRGQQTSLALHMLHVGTQHQTPRPRQSRCGRHGLSNILKLQATFLYSIYHQRAAGADLAHFQLGVWVWVWGVGEGYRRLGERLNRKQIGFKRGGGGCPLTPL